MKSKILISTILICFGLSFHDILSQQLIDTLNIQEVVITATKTERLLEEIPGKADIINLKQIRLLPAMKTDDLLRFVSGVNVSRSNGIYSIRPSVTIRGISGDEQGRTLVLMNGMPLNTSDDGGVNWNRIQPYTVQKVEIFKGPGSSLYGNNAMGGVINIITRKPVKSLEGMAGMAYGTYNTARPEIYLGSRLDNGLTLTLSGFYQNSDGYNAVPDSLRQDPDYSVARFLQEGSVSTGIGYELAPLLNVELQYDYYSDKRSEGEKIRAPEGEYRSFATHFSRIRLRGNNEKMNYDLGFYFQREHYSRIDERMRGGNYSRFDVDSYRDDMGVVFNSTYDLSDNQTLTGGIEWKKGTVDGGDYYKTSSDTVINRGSISSLSLYLQDELSLFDDKLRLITGIRADRVMFYDGEFIATGPGVDYLEQYTPGLEDHSWFAISPRIAARYFFIEKISGYVSYSRGFRASILDDLCRTGYRSIGPKIANPWLGPEYLNNYESGLNIGLWENLVLEPSVYYSAGNDFLYFVATGDSLFGRAVYRRENVTRVGITGIELDARFQVNDQLLFRANYTYNRSEIVSFDERPELTGKALTYTPSNRGTASILWQNKIVQLGFSLLIKGRQFTDDLNEQTIPGYSTADLRISREFLHDHLNITFSMMDIFDNEHMENTEFISPGRLISGRLSVRF